MDCDINESEARQIQPSNKRTLTLKSINAFIQKYKQKFGVNLSKEYLYLNKNDNIHSIEGQVIRWINKH